MKLLLTFLLFFTTSFTGDNHEFHLSKSIIEYNSEDQALQITMHLFIDDLEEALKLQGAEKLFLCTEKESDQSDAFILKYLEKSFSVQVDGKELKYNWIGKEASEDLQAIWCYLEIPEMNKPAQLTVTNNTLMDVFDDQRNLINILGPDDKEGYFIFEKGNATDSVDF